MIQSKLLRPFMAVLVALPLLFAAAPAKAGGEGALLIFYGAIKLSQAQAIKATANYYEAIGMGARAQQYTRLADDFQSGSLGGQEGMKAFVQSSSAVEQDINALQALGAYPTSRQRELAKKAREQLAVAKISLVAGVAIGTKGVLDSGGNVFEKIALGAIVGIEAAQAISAIKRVSRAARAYENFELGGSNGFQLVSKEVQPQFVEL